MTHAPIALFAYNRPDHVRRTIGTLRANAGAEASDLFIYADGPRSKDAAPKVAETRAVLRDVTGFKSVTLIERETNLGLARSIITGVDDLTGRFGSVIVIEDDLILSPHFLRFMNDALDRYADEPTVMQVSGHMFDIDLAQVAEDALLLPLTTSWGWATWARAWRQFDPEMTAFDHLAASPERRQRYDLDGRYPYFDLLMRQRDGKVDSWAIRWYLSVFERDGLVVFPRQTLVENGGMDGSGTHCGPISQSQTRRMMPHVVWRWPDTIAPSPAFEAVKHAIGASAKPRSPTQSTLSWLARKGAAQLQRLYRLRPKGITGT